MSRARSHVAVGWVLGLTLLISGFISIGSTLFPLRVGNPEWELGTLGELAATMGLAVLGLAAVLAVALYDRRRVPLILIGLLALGLGVVGFMSLGLLATDAPLALDAARYAASLDQARGIKIVLFKSAVLLTLFSVGLFTVGLGAIRSFQRSR